MTWPEAFTEVLSLLIMAAVLVLIFCGWPGRGRRNDDS